MLSCTEDALRELPETCADGAFGAWERARRDIDEEWMHATDPARFSPASARCFGPQPTMSACALPTGCPSRNANGLPDALKAP